MQDYQLTKKQNYLYKEIIEGGYNPEQFQSFLISHNNNIGDNLEQWNLDDLKKIVQQFKLAHPLEQKQQIASSKEEQPQQIALTSQKPQTKQDDRNEGKYSVTIKCIKKKLPQLFNEKLEIRIIKFNKKEGGLFEKSYITYEILVEPLHIKIERRYSDFEWLKEKINYVYPGFPIPPLSKKGQYRSFDEKHIRKRQLILQKFLNKIVNISQLKSDELVNGFLTIQQSSAFQKFKSKYKGLVGEIQPHKISNIQGQVTMQINKNLSTFLLQSQKYFSEVQPMVKKIYKDFKGCVTSLEACSQTFKNIGSHCKSIWKYDNQFRTHLKLPLFENNIYSNFQLISQQYSQLLLKQARLLRNQMYALVKYQSLYMLNMIQSLENLAVKQQMFAEVRTNLLKRKLKLYEFNDISKWGCQVKLTQKPKTREQAFPLMLHKQTMQAKKLRDSYALYNQQIYKECQRYFRQTNRYVGKYVKEYMQSQSKLNSEGMILWADMISNAMGMQQDKSIKYTSFK